MENVSSLAFIMVVGQFTAAVALLNGILTTLGQAKVAAAAIESIARQPEARGPITSSMFVGLAMAETSGIYGLVVALILLFANPVAHLYVQLAALM